MSVPSIPQSTNPYVIVPAIGRVLEALWARAQRLGQATFTVSNRQLAETAGLASAGHIPRLLRQLEADGHLSLDGRTVTLTRTPIPTGDAIPRGIGNAIPTGIKTPENAIPRGIDPNADHPSDPAWDRAFAASDCENTGDPAWDRHNSAYKVHESSSSKEKETRLVFLDWLLTQDGMRRRTAQRVIDSHVGGLADFEADLLRANTTPGVSNPLYFVVSTWLDGTRVPEPPPPATAPTRRTTYRRGSSHLASSTGPIHVPYLPPEFANLQFDEAGHVLPQL